MIIGITGGIGSGKSTVCKILIDAGCVLVDADRISHEITADNMPAVSLIAEKISNEVVHDGVLDRKALAEIVFNDEEKLRTLNNILHKEIFERCKSEIEAAKGKTVALDVPLMFEGGYDKWCDTVIAVSCDENTRIERVMKRDGCTRDQVIQRINKQMPDEERNRRADYVIVNNGSKDDLKKEVICLLIKILRQKFPRENV